MPANGRLRARPRVASARSPFRLCLPDCGPAAATAALSSACVRGVDATARLPAVNRATTVLPRTTGIARLELDALDPAHDRGRDHEPFVYARLAFLVDRHAHRAAFDPGDVDFDGARPQSHRQDQAATMTTATSRGFSAVHAQPPS